MLHDAIHRLALAVQANILANDDILEQVRLLNLKVTALTAPRVIDDAVDEPFWIAHVTEVKNLTVNGEPVTTGKQLWDLRDRLDPALYQEIWAAVNDAEMLEAGIKSRLPKPSGPPQYQPNGAGTAPSVA